MTDVPRNNNRAPEIYLLGTKNSFWQKKIVFGSFCWALYSFSEMQEKKINLFVDRLLFINNMLCVAATP